MGSKQAVDTHRSVSLNLLPQSDKPPNSDQYADNVVVNAKYSILTFLPINLFAQFSRVANLYFLFIGSLQLIPGLSPTHWFTTVAPLGFVLLVNAVKEIYDDVRRHKQDAQVNGTQVEVLRVGKTDNRVPWRDVKVGDVVRLRVDEEVPADVLLLSSSDPKNLAFVETANLDGETNLKLKYCFPGSVDVKDIDSLQRFAQRHQLKCELPNQQLYRFEGSVVNAEGEQPVDASTLMLRGCRLRKTEWVIAFVVFAGVETKIVMNQAAAPRKVTLLERHMNWMVGGVFVLQCLLSALCAIGQAVFLSGADDHHYLPQIDKWPELGSGVAGTLVQFLRFVILLNQLIPISLYVTLEVVKVTQCAMLSLDRHMYHADSDTPFSCRTTTLNEELGQVSYVLSDKTGTLTQNVMGFVWASVAGRLYGADPEQQDEAAAAARPGVPAASPHTVMYDAGLWSALSATSAALAGDTAAKDAAPDSVSDIGGMVPGSSEACTDEFFMCLAVCNTVVPATDSTGRLTYQAESPDEEALVEGAARLGYELLERGVDAVQLRALGQSLKLEVLCVLEFDSDRKRMSVLCRMPGGGVRLYCKGADSIILARVAPDDPNRAATIAHLNRAAVLGYRTLCIAQRDLSQQWFEEWWREYHAASVSLTNREEAVAAAAARLECELSLLGATVVEDKLQDGVPETIATLLQAGIKVWVLTGDKRETAISISHACNLFHDGMELVVLAGDGMETDDAVNLLLEAKAAHIRVVSGDGKSCGLVIEGDALAAMLEEACQDRFFELCELVHSVVCCRATPMQKAQVTQMVKVKAKAVTLGIGDGANDVGMILAAQIGVGISGREGRAAVLSSDFSLAQFRFLSRLLLVHGRWAYKRNSEVVLYAFYKNLVYVCGNVWLAVVSGFSSQPLYNSAMIATFNLFWTSWPTIVYAVLEQDISPRTALAHPQIYHETRREDRSAFLVKALGWALDALLHTIIINATAFSVIPAAAPDGQLGGLPAVGAAAYTAVVVLVNLKVAQHTRFWTVFHHALLWGVSIGLYFPFLAIVSVLPTIFPDMQGVAAFLFTSPVFWIGIVIGAPLFAMAVDTLISYARWWWRPSDTQVLQQLERLQEKRAKDANTTPLSASHALIGAAGIFSGEKLDGEIGLTEMNTSKMSG